MGRPVAAGGAGVGHHRGGGHAGSPWAARPPQRHDRRDERQWLARPGGAHPSVGGIGARCAGTGAGRYGPCARGWGKPPRRGAPCRGGGSVGSTAHYGWAATGCAQRCVRGARSLVGQPRRVWGAASTAESWVASCQSGRMALTMAGCAAAAAATATIASVAAAAAITRAAAAAAAVAPAVAPAVPTRRRRRRLHGIGVVAGTQPCPPSPCR